MAVFEDEPRGNFWKVNCMTELFLISGCACLAYLAVALLVCWVRDECRDTSAAKLLTSRMMTSQHAAFMEPAGLPTVAPLAKSELDPKDLSVPLIP
jgi:hypothetical protein